MSEADKPWQLPIFFARRRTWSRATLAEYYQEQIELWIQHSSPKCYELQLSIEARLGNHFGELLSIDTIAKHYKPLVELAISEFQRELQPECFSVSVDDICTALAREYMAGSRRGA